MTREKLPFYARKDSGGRYLLDVWVQPGAKRNDLAGEYQGRLKVRVAAPASDNKANKALTGYLAELLDVKKSQVSVQTGHTGRKKTLAVRTENPPAWPEPGGVYTQPNP
ncbi:DUF167 domain-containing protein [Desulfohalovibrio reitneri]|uniref:DUF167 domain-containing protein n=1 Tax=Desulfohalovibrio reitneri TaxID=1307759 RepID=UPI000ABE058D|nr:DUF167 domain-containing protein [Desulfohalovibrio reitneri]